MNQATLEAMQTLAARLGATAEQLWAQWTRYAVLHSVAAILMSVVTALATLVLARWAYLKVSSPEGQKPRHLLDSSWDPELWCPIIVVVVACVVFGCAVAAVNNVVILLEPAGYLVSRLARVP